MTCPVNTAPDNYMLRAIVFVSKILSSAETHYNNIEREALGIQHGFQTFHLYCFARGANHYRPHFPM